jgi:hypothetical protein
LQKKSMQYRRTDRHVSLVNRWQKNLEGKGLRPNPVHGNCISTVWCKVGCMRESTAQHENKYLAARLGESVRGPRICAAGCLAATRLALFAHLRPQCHRLPAVWTP